MFLKRIEVSGFKSFADKANIVFESEVTGIVGPNGCGKSNIADAIRWVLGEQSPKSLRGSAMTDVIFNGSEKRRPLSKAEVTLVFDNSRRIMDINYDEVEITRVLYRNNSEAEYLLNRTSCRLKDITTLLMDTGIGKDSLSIISQGNIASFAEAKPEDRRGIFEEAAGVSKYKKRKLESLSKLEKTKDNLNRLDDVISEIERQVNPLKKQAEKARQYIEKKAKLEEIEIAVLVDEVTTLHEHVTKINQTLEDLNEEKLRHDANISIYDGQLVQMKQDMSMLDNEVHELQSALFQIVDEIRGLEARRIEIDEKRKNWLANHEEDASAERISQLQIMREEARLEYEDRQRRMDATSAEIEELKEQINTKAELKKEADERLGTCQSKLHRMESRKDVLHNLIRQPLLNQAGVRAIMDAKRSLVGIEGVVVDILKPMEGYENAISVALGGALWNVVTKDSEAARNAISFLKRNESGRATFLPLNILAERYMNREHELLAQQVEGYLGKASEKVEYEPQYRSIAMSFLNNVLLCDTLEHANQLGELLKHGYKIVTLDGDVVHRGGSMSGGKVKNQETPLVLRKEYEEIDALIEEAKKETTIWQTQQHSLERDLIMTNDIVVQRRITLAQLEPIVTAKRSKFERISDELAQLGRNMEDEETVQVADDLIIQLNQAHQLKDQITSNIQEKRDRRFKLMEQTEQIEQDIRGLRREVSQLGTQIRELDIQKARKETQLETGLMRLGSEYKMTYEYALANCSKEINVEEARNEVSTLRQQIDALGHINMNAPEEYEEIKTRFEFYTTSKKELEEASEKILGAISEMDKIMTVEFKTTFDQINQELDGTFRMLFGGGHAKLVMVDPDNILETGIDIDVQPPGKAVQNIRLFSGGEKSLIALSVLFSILKVRVVPLCILDEVEAALDQANVERFARYLKQFSETTQFLVVTHRPGTMEKCDVLYGVTMQQKGVSQMIRVKLADAMQLTEKEVLA